MFMFFLINSLCLVIGPDSGTGPGPGTESKDVVKYTVISVLYKLQIKSID